MAMWKWIVGVPLVVLALLIVSAFFGARSRNRRLDEWGASVPLTEAQREAMRKLWRAFKAACLSEEDPLTKLSENDRAYIKTICSADYRPAHFGSGKIARLALAQALLDKGYSPEQTAVLVGMVHNRVGLSEI
jgi:hypothetical protein